MKILIISPTYNEAGNVTPLAQKIFTHVPNAHICFVDDGSQDGTDKEIENLQNEFKDRVFLIQRPGKLGLGSAYICGFQWGLQRDFDVFVEMDADHSHRPEDLPRVIDGLKTADVAIGSRYIGGGGTENWSFTRKLISRFGSLYGRLILGLRIQDFTGGFNAWKRIVLETIPLDFIRSEGYAFQIELKYRASQFGFRLVEVPIVFVERQVGKSKMSGRIVLEAFWRLWQFRCSSIEKFSKQNTHDATSRSHQHL